MSRISPLLSALATAALLAACASAPSLDPKAIGETRPGSGYLNGYLTAKELPDSLALVLPPPQDGSPAKEADRAAYRALTALQNTPRGDLARLDAELTFPQAADAFACALDVDITEQDTPHLMMLRRRTLVDAGLATYAAKSHYQRTRPFVEFGEGQCTPEKDAALRKDGSYPSGHSALAWAWALILTEIAPERSNAILQRGHAMGQSRGICGVHWQSDIVAGREVGAATVARLHANPTFRAQLALAQKEVKSGKAPDKVNCAAQALRATY